MVPRLDPSTLDPGTSRLKLVDELVFTPQVVGNETRYRVENPSSGKFYWIGYAEYVLISLFDIGRTVAQAQTIMARTLGRDALDQSRCLEVSRWLVEHDLATLEELSECGMASLGESTGAKGDHFGRMNPFWIRCSLGAPRRFLQMLAAAVGWIYSPLGTLIGLILIAVGAVCIFSDWEHFLASASTLLTPNNGLWLILAWLVLKIIHEFSHALSCQYYGGEVKDMGVVFILLAPMAYVDVTSCWRFPSRWQRIHVAAAGMFAELVVAGIAAILWARSDSAVVEHLLFNVIIMASLTTLLFNANPLMRFDGYYILSDLLQIPNLSGEGNRALRSAAARLFFGLKRSPLQESGLRGWIVFLYGVAAAGWRIVICLSLISAASVLFHGAGLVWALLGAIVWFGAPLWQIGRELNRRLDENRVSFVRAIAITFAITSLGGFVLLGVPWPGAMTVPVVVDHADAAIVRCGASGFVEQVYSEDGQVVSAGDLLMELSNDELTAERSELELAYEHARLTHRRALNSQNAGEAQIVQRNLQAIQERLDEFRQRCDRLQVRAPIAGRVVARNLHLLDGTYLEAGDEILIVADETNKELVASVGQEEIDMMFPSVGRSIRFRIGARRSIEGTLVRLEPRASHQLPHWALSSTAGGPLAVRQDAKESTSGVRLVEPRFKGVIAVPQAVSRSLGCGERGYAILGLRQVSIGQYVWVQIRRWWESLLRPESLARRRAEPHNRYSMRIAYKCFADGVG